MGVEASPSRHLRETVKEDGILQGGHVAPSGRLAKCTCGECSNTAVSVLHSPPKSAGSLPDPTSTKQTFRLHLSLASRRPKAASDCGGTWGQSSKIQAGPALTLDKAALQPRGKRSVGTPSSPRSPSRDQ